MAMLRGVGARYGAGAGGWNWSRGSALTPRLRDGDSSRMSSTLHYLDIVPFKPSLTTSYIHGATNMPLVGKTIGQYFDETVDKHPDREALVFVRDGVRKTFGQLKQEVDQMAAGLLAIGLQKGDCLGIWGPNVYEWLLVQLATAKAGIILTSINPAIQARELEFLLKKVDCKALVCPLTFKTQKYYNILKQICPELEKATAGDLRSNRLPDLRSVIMIGDKLPGTFSFKEVFEAASSSHHVQLLNVQKKISFDDPINILFTSGTTGFPKGATLSHHNVVNNARYVGYRIGYNWREARICVPVPLCHIFGSVGASLMMAIYGCHLCFPSPSFEPQAALEAVPSERCTIMYGTPTMYVGMLGQKDFSSFDLSTLEGGILGGSPCPSELAKQIMDRMKIQEIIVVYGTTENSPVTFQGFPQDEIKRKTETVGYISPHIEAKVVDPQTKEILPVNTAGELWIRGYSVMLGYWNDPEKTKEVITPEGWYRTGDIATLDPYGYCKIVGRIKEMIIRGGENIYPAELEAFLHKYPKVLEVQVIGVHDDKMGEEVCACVKLHDGTECTAEELWAYCKGQIAHFKIPRYIVFVKDFPLTASGKIPKYKLRENLERELKLRPE
ncbi:medium-chain acyl-CoA ligase ACSF2, mitochondrial isoform X1 [Hypanus sabinus]|uniref:medium-chain acyl-CoA ligase ACSF2, mitochondrial isoform X1 n=1 Tax=Hypanus sabinus TaxID=79690 RepID=UPI0028C386F2|nr:medium-chain acyl-CoA ligase ACSF2, mitochondrial isoform X1 [Hypanus sabinus]